MVRISRRDGGVPVDEGSVARLAGLDVAIVECRSPWSKIDDGFGDDSLVGPGLGLGLNIGDCLRNRALGILPAEEL